MRFFLVLSLLSGCAATRALAPLDKGQVALNASLGGPFVEVNGGPLPLPITSLGASYGLDGKTNLHGALYPTQLALFGVFGLDLGASRELVTPHKGRPRLMADLTLYTFGGNRAQGEPRGGIRFFPDISLVASWPLGKHFVPYVGTDQFFQFFPTPHWAPSLLVGAELRAGKRLGIQLEGKWIEPWGDTDPLVPHWYGAGTYGAFSAQLGFNVYFGEGAP